MLRVLLLGGSGFLGKAISQKLKSCSEITLIQASREIVSAQDTDKIQLELSKSKLDLANKLQTFDVVVNCIGELSNEDKMDSVNFLLVKNMVDAIVENKLSIRLLQVSSVGCYGAIDRMSHKKRTTIEESSIESPKGLYEVTKTQADDYIKSHATRESIWSYTIVRPTNIFGENMKSSALMRLFNMVQNQRFFYVGSVDAISTYIHVDDVALGVLLCINQLERSKNQVFILSDDCKQKELINLASEYYGVNHPRYIIPIALVKTLVAACRFIFRKCPVSTSAIESLASRVSFSNKKARSILGFQPQRSIYHYDELRTFIEHLQRNE